MGGGLLAETGVGAGDEDGFGGEGGGGWWGLVDELRKEVAPDAHVVVVTEGIFASLGVFGRWGWNEWVRRMAPFFFSFFSGKIVCGDVRRFGFHDRPGRETFT